MKPASAAMSAILRWRQLRIAQQRGGLFQPPFQHVMGEALAGLFEQQMHVARRDAEQHRNRDSAQARIATATLDLVQNGGKARGASAAFLRDRAPFTLSAKRERDKIDNVFTVKFGRPASCSKGYRKADPGDN